jgi:spoIIIJ-associated protein
MSTKVRSVEAKGEDVQQAVETGLQILGLDRQQVSIEVLDEGSAGFLGIRSRDAVVKLTEKIETNNLEIPESEGVAEEQAFEAVEAQEMAAVKELASAVEPAEVETADEDFSERDAALDIVTTLLDKMQVETTISVRQTDPDDLTGEKRWIIDIQGQDLGILIGPRGETLNSLQYLSRLIAGNTLRRRAKFIIDVEGYRQRREGALARLAERMADKAIKRGRPVSLEPMPPNERRIIHITLRDDDRVYTESNGDGRRRKVVIFPKD